MNHFLSSFSFFLSFHLSFLCLSSSFFVLYSHHQDAVLLLLPKGWWASGGRCSWARRKVRCTIKTRQKEGCSSSPFIDTNSCVDSTENSRMVRMMTTMSIKCTDRPQLGIGVGAVDCKATHRVGSSTFGQFVRSMTRWKARNQKNYRCLGRVQILVFDGASRDCRLNCERREYQLVGVFSLRYSICGRPSKRWYNPAYFISRIKPSWRRHEYIFIKW